MPCYKYTIASNPYKVCATVHSLQHMLPSIYMMPIPLSVHEITSYVAMWSAMAEPGIVAILVDNLVHNPVGENKSSTYH